MPRRDYEGRALRKQRSHVFLVDVVDVPLPLEVVHGTEQFLAAIGIDRLDRHRLAAHVHVRLEVLQAGGRLHHMEVLRHAHLSRRNVELLVDRLEQVQNRAVLRHIAFRVEIHTELDHVVHHLFADRVHVDLPADPGARQHQFARVLREDLADLADRPFHEQEVAHPRVSRRARQARYPTLLPLKEESEGVVYDPPSIRIGGLHLDRTHPTRLREPRLDGRPEPLVLRHGRQRVGLGLDDQVRLTETIRELPAVRIRELHRRWLVRRVAVHSALIHPGDDRLDLLVGKATVVLEALNAHRTVDVVRRHYTVRDLHLDQRRVSPHLLVGQQRHRRHRVGLMTDLALLLEDRRHVPSVGDFRVLRHEIRRRQGDHGHHSEHDTTKEHTADFRLCHGSNLSFRVHGLTDTLTYPLVQQH